MKPALKPALVHSSEPGIQLQLGIPIPPKRNGSPEKYPWSQMTVGASFFITSWPYKNFSSFYTLAKKRGIKITCRRIGAGIRVWRVK